MVQCRVQERLALFNKRMELSRYPHVLSGFPAMWLRAYELRADDSRLQRRNRATSVIGANKSICPWEQREEENVKSTDSGG
jgi:hypothetical protein